MNLRKFPVPYDTLGFGRMSKEVLGVCVTVLLRSTYSMLNTRKHQKRNIATGLVLLTEGKNSVRFGLYQPFSSSLSLLDML